MRNGYTEVRPDLIFGIDWRSQETSYMLLLLKKKIGFHECKGYQRHPFRSQLTQLVLLFLFLLSFIPDPLAAQHPPEQIRGLILRFIGPTTINYGSKIGVKTSRHKRGASPQGK